MAIGGPVHGIIGGGSYGHVRSVGLTSELKWPRAASLSPPAHYKQVIPPA